MSDLSDVSGQRDRSRNPDGNHSISTNTTAASGEADSLIPGAALELRQLQRGLLRAVTSHAKTESLLPAIGSIVNQSINPIAIRYFRRDEHQRLLSGWEWLSGGANKLSTETQATIVASCDTACAQGRLEFTELENDKGYVALAAPVFLRNRAPEALVLVLPTTTRHLERAIVILQLVASHITLWHVVQESSTAESDAQAAAALLEIVAKLGSCDDLRHASYTLACELKDYLKCTHVALGLRHGRQGVCRLKAISGNAQFDKHSELARAYEATLEEALTRGSLAQWPATGDSQGHAARALQTLCSKTGLTAAISALLEDERGETVGAWVFLSDKDFAQRQPTVDFIRASSLSVGSCSAPKAGGLDILSGVC